MKKEEESAKEAIHDCVRAAADVSVCGLPFFTCILTCYISVIVGCYNKMLKEDVGKLVFKPTKQENHRQLFQTHDLCFTSVLSGRNILLGHHFYSLLRLK